MAEKPTVWPTEIQNRAQAIFDAGDGIFRADHPDLARDHNGEQLVFCGECGRVATTNPDNDLCAACENAIAQKEPNNG